MKKPGKKSAEPKASQLVAAAQKAPKRANRKSTEASSVQAGVGAPKQRTTEQVSVKSASKERQKATKSLVTSTEKKPSTQAPPPAPSGALKQAPSLVLERDASRKTEGAKTAFEKPVEAAKLPNANEPKPIVAKSAKPVRSPKATPRTQAAEKPLIIPPILLEGDLPPAPKSAGPGARYALVVQPPVVPAPKPPTEARTELPEGYGTRRLFLTARDPRWLYASWDLIPEQQREYNRRSRDGHLILRVYAEAESRPAVPEVHVNPESRNFFVNVPKPETRYWAELGFYTRSGAWEQITRSQSTFTPPDAPSPEPAAVEFATIPAQVTFEQVVKTVQEFVTEHQPLLEAVVAAQEAEKRNESSPKEASLQANSENPARQIAKVRAIPLQETEPPPHPSANAPKPKRVHQNEKLEIPVRVEQARPWTPDRKQALARLIQIDGYRRVWMGSIEITELVRRQLEEEIASIAAAELAASQSAGRRAAELMNVSSPLGGEIPARDRKFWFKVNAELIIYGATEPNARVTVAGRAVKLRPDGTFSFRFALPDGRYGLPAVAASADGVEAREARLEFSRSTEYSGHVESHPQAPGLRPPRPENL